MDLTEFQKSKMKEWEEFGKQYPSHGYKNLKTLGCIYFGSTIIIHSSSVSGMKNQSCAQTNGNFDRNQYKRRRTNF